MEKITQEEEKKFISIKNFVDEFSKLNTPHVEIEQTIKDTILQLRTLLIPLGQDRIYLKDIEEEINSNVNNPEMNDLFMDDPITQSMLQYIKISKNYDSKKEQSISIMAQGFIDIVNTINELALKPKIKTEFIGDEEQLNEEEITSIKNKATRWILYWKKANSGQKKLLEYQIYKETLNSKQKYSIINDIFFEHTGEYILDRIKKEREKKDADSAKPE